METKRQKQVAEMIKRHFSTILIEEGRNIYGAETLVSVTGVQMSPDLSFAKIYLSIFNAPDSSTVLQKLDSQLHHLKQQLTKRLRNQLRRTPDLALYSDDTMEEIQKIDQIFKKIKDSSSGEGST